MNSSNINEEDAEKQTFKVSFKVAKTCFYFIADLIKE